LKCALPRVHGREIDRWGALSKSAQIASRRLQTVRVFGEVLSHPAVARIAQQPTDLTRFVAVIDNQPTLLLTDQTLPLLRLRHGLDISDRDAVGLSQVVVAHVEPAGAVIV
jgi:hypothetical protein